ncbi:SOS response-associated peptidase family protein [Stenotrophomonas sp.]|jgi:putative SOS response-associated peptidase YedK|uniref:SOS response-associated peptidase family protein n=1 Tax=Stenotrophomonas sp. TaxID=69392 RepID=UPI00333E21BD
MRKGGLGTFTIITGDSSGVSADIHDRMPAWLQPGQVDDWMAAEPDDAVAILLASKPPTSIARSTLLIVLVERFLPRT